MSKMSIDTTVNKPDREVEKSVWNYRKQGINVLPANIKEKRTNLKGYKKYQTQFASDEEIKEWLKKGKFQNIFALLGKISNNITEIDVDVPDTQLEDIFTDVKEAKRKVWIAESSMGKKKIYCRGETIEEYDDQVVSNKEYTQPNGKISKPHVEYSGGNKGSILPPSIHYSGSQYKWLNLDKNGNLPELSIVNTKKLYNSIVQKLRAKNDYIVTDYPKDDKIHTKKRKKQVRHCFLESHDNGDKWDGKFGQDFRTAVACELVVCNYNDDEILEFFKTHDDISVEKYDRKITIDHIERIRNKKMHKWGCLKIQKKYGFIVKDYCDTCPKNKEKEDTALYVSSFSLPDDKKHLEEVLIDGIEKFVLYDKKTDTWEIVDLYPYGGIEIKPYPIDPAQRGSSLIIPDGVEEYGTLGKLVEEMHKFALEEYDPVDDPELYELTIILTLSSWVLPGWQKHMAEKFIPILNARGGSETGKKRFLTITRWLTYHSFYALKTNRVPTLFRAIDPLKGTLILDEADMDDSTLSSELVQFLNSRCDGVSIPRYNSNIDKIKIWKSFGMTVLATRAGFTDDGLESRCVVMPTATTDNPEKIHLIPPNEWMEKGKRLQRKLLLFKLRHLDWKMPTQLTIENVSSFRVRESLLIAEALKEEDPTLLERVKKLAVTLQERIIKERAASPEGLVLNIIYNTLIDDNVILETSGLGYIIIEMRKKKTDTGVDEYQVPLTLRSVSKSLGESFSPSQIAKMWRGLNQDTVPLKRINKKRFRGLIQIKKLKRIDKIFPKYVPDYITPAIFGPEQIQPVIEKKHIATLPDKSPKNVVNETKVDTISDVESSKNVVKVIKKGVFEI